MNAVKRRGAIYIWFEPILLFCLLFLPGISLPGTVEMTQDFFAAEELTRILIHDLPALTLVVFFWRNFPQTAPVKGLPPFAWLEKPRTKDLKPAFFCFLALLALSMPVNFAASVMPDSGSLVFPAGPETVFDWLAVFLSCVSVAYLEETFFRAYLQAKAAANHLDFNRALAVSALLFAVCHLYEGVWGVVNALLAGVVLALFYKKTQSLHAVAWAHALYNLCAYAAQVF